MKPGQRIWNNNHKLLQSIQGVQRRHKKKMQQPTSTFTKSQDITDSWHTNFQMQNGPADFKCGIARSVFLSTIQSTQFPLWGQSPCLIHLWFSCAHCICKALGWGLRHEGCESTLRPLGSSEANAANSLQGLNGKPDRNWGYFLSTKWALHRRRSDDYRK